MPLFQHLKTIFATGVVLIFSFPGVAQAPSRFDRLSIVNGPVNPRIRCFLQDSRGFMWIGSEGGLSRYDGQKVKTYVYDPDDPAGHWPHAVFDMIEDKKGNIWFCGQGISVYDSRRDAFTHYFPDKKASDPAANFVSELHEDSKGHLWLALPLGGFLFLTGKRKLFFPFPNIFCRIFGIH